MLGKFGVSEKRIEQVWSRETRTTRRTRRERAAGEPANHSTSCEAPRDCKAVAHAPKCLMGLIDGLDPALGDLKVALRATAARSGRFSDSRGHEILGLHPVERGIHGPN